MKPILVTCVAVALFIAGAEIFLVLGCPAWSASICFWKTSRTS